jgi:hypothetical protein
MEHFGKDKAANNSTLISLHEITDSLLEGSSSLLTREAITNENYEAVLSKINCINQHQFVSIEREMLTVMQKSYTLYRSGDIIGLGKVYGTLTT